MKKGKMIISVLALFVALGGAYALKASNTLPGDLYYYNDLGDCVKAPCEKTNRTGAVCENAPLYEDAGCGTEYTPQAWVTIGGK